jgi:RNA polymerase sigma-70 factor (ECF subfamily)
MHPYIISKKQAYWGKQAPVMDFEQLVQQHKDAVYRQLLKLCHNREDAEDLLIEALSRASQSISQLKDPNSFQAWLVGIARRIYRRMKRREELHPMLRLDSLSAASPLLRSGDQPPDEHAIEEELDHHLRRTLDHLPRIYRETYRLHDLEEVPIRRIAERLKVSEAAVKSRLHRARAMLRERLDVELHRDVPHTAKLKAGA